jgi:hypothetical protein
MHWFAESVFVNVYGAQESIPINRFCQAAVGSWAPTLKRSTNMGYGTGPTLPSATFSHTAGTGATLSALVYWYWTDSSLIPSATFVRLLVLEQLSLHWFARLDRLFVNSFSNFSSHCWYIATLSLHWFAGTGPTLPLATFLTLLALEQLSQCIGLLQPTLR